MKYSSLFLIWRRGGREGGREGGWEGGEDELVGLIASYEGKHGREGTMEAQIKKH